ncbi:sulfurtransferase [Alkalilimnicola ehrlichii MLHE-1]|nr:rhodanese-like domain-containing protein [Alkalilimnicola ehrlichii]
MRRIILLTALALLLPLSAAARQGDPLPGPLVSADWLAAHLDDVVVLDIRTDIDSFSTGLAPSDDEEGMGLCSDPLPMGSHRIEGHIPGARLVRLADITGQYPGPNGPIGGMLAEPAAFQAAMQAAGVNAGQPVVVTSQGLSISDMANATRLYFALRHFGHDSVALLDGGVAGWIDAGHDFATRQLPFEPGDFQAGPGDATLLATRGQIEAGEAGALVDGRSGGEFRGLLDSSSVAGRGHLPGALHIPMGDLGSSGRPAYLHDTERQQATFSAVPDGPLTVYCDTGRRATLHWFVLNELLGKPARLYDGSLHEWTHQGGDLARP